MLKKSIVAGLAVTSLLGRGPEVWSQQLRIANAQAVGDSPLCDREGFARQPNEEDAAGGVRSAAGLPDSPPASTLPLLNSKVDSDPGPQAGPSGPSAGTKRSSHHLRNFMIAVGIGAVLYIVLAAAAK